jgi:hypothetical protein
LTTKRTKHQRELYELAGEFFALSKHAYEAWLTSTVPNEIGCVFDIYQASKRGACEAIKLAESAK